MARNVYSQRFIVARGLAGASQTVTAPAGYVYVVKQLTFYANPLLQPARGFFRDLGSGATLFSAATQAGTPGWFGFYGALAFEPGDSFRWEADVGVGDAIDVFASGYTLTLP